MLPGDDAVCSVEWQCGLEFLYQPDSLASTHRTIRRKIDVVRGEKSGRSKGCYLGDQRWSELASRKRGQSCSQVSMYLAQAVSRRCPDPLENERGEVPGVENKGKVSSHPAAVAAACSVLDRIQTFSDVPRIVVGDATLSR